MTVKNPFDQTRKFQFANSVKKITPLGNSVIVSNMTFGERFTSSGIVLLGDDGKASGIRPRWGQVYAIGPNQVDVKVGDWVLIAHGRWSRGVEIESDGKKLTIRRVDPADIMLSSDSLPADDTISTAL